MTNGEKIKTMFPSMIVGFITESQIGVYFVKNQHSANVFDLEWWNTEYKEPTTLNDLGVDCISREKAIDAFPDLLPNMGYNKKAITEILHEIPPVTPQEPKIKVLDNDEVARKLGTVDIYKANAWVTLLKDLEYLGMKICEVEE